MTTARNVTTVLFDLGNTLLDYHRSIKARERTELEILRQLGVSMTLLKLRSEKRKLLVGRYYSPSHEAELFWIDFLKRLGLKYSTRLVDSLGDEQIAKWRSAFLRDWKLYPEVQPILRKLKARELKLGVVANIVKEARSDFLDRYNLTDFFDAILLSEEVGISKPNRKIFELALNSLKSRPANSVFIGDRLDTDIAPAKSLGMKTIRIRRGEYRYQQPKSKKELPDYTVDTLSKIFRIRPPIFLEGKAGS